MNDRMMTMAMKQLLVCLCALNFICGSAFAVDAKPNVILILADDLGWTDLACFGSDLHETPALDRLARDGMKFTQNYSACTVCSPTRSALMTGKYPARLHITDWIPGMMPDNPKLLVPDWTKYLPLEETTLAEVFKADGYTTATIGKWHLGGEAYYPEKQGFDLNIAGTHNGAIRTFFAPWKISTLTPEGNAGDYLTDRLGEEAVQFIERAKDRPFFLYLPHYAVHTPIQGRADLVEKYQKKIRAGLNHKNAAYAAMTESLDMAVGRVRAKLDEHKLADRTMIVFTSDNGGRVPTTSNVPLRVGKASAYEGGVRVPLIVHWPAVTKPGSTTSSAAPCLMARFARATSSWLSSSTTCASSSTTSASTSGKKSISPDHNRRRSMNCARGSTPGARKSARSCPRRIPGTIPPAPSTHRGRKRRRRPSDSTHTKNVIPGSLSDLNLKTLDILS